MWLDVLVIAVLAVFAVFGAWRGALVAGFGLLSLAGAYGVAIFTATRVGLKAAAQFELSPWFASAAVGTFFFLATYGTISGIGGWLARRETAEDAGSRSARDRFLGACFGCARGAFVVLLLCLLAIWVDALRVTGGASALPPIGESRAAAMTGDLVEAGVAAAFADSGPGGRAVARWAAHPAPAAAALQGLLESAEIATLQDDRLFWTYVESGAVDSALNRSSFRALADDAEMRQRLADLGAIDVSVAADPIAFRREAGAMLRELGPRLRELREDPELHALMEDPEIAARVEAGDTLGLLAHSDFRRYVTRIATH